MRTTGSNGGRYKEDGVGVGRESSGLGVGWVGRMGGEGARPLTRLSLRALLARHAADTLRKSGA